ncbi:hypothetical protein HY485_03335, partial [Candidatus Woesearchaeota archaeon]|nr:hypothetical protein [Candidatus Woesearchaeota archaeon]
KKSKKIIITLLSVFIIITIVMHAQNLNAWRGAWGDYFIGWQNVGNYIDANAQNSVLVEQYNHGNPFYFRTNNSQILLKNITEYRKLFSISKNFTTVYVADTKPVEAKQYLELETEIGPEDNSLYAKIKGFFGRHSQRKFYVYKFVPLTRNSRN